MDNVFYADAMYNSKLLEGLRVFPWEVIDVLLSGREHPSLRLSSLLSRSLLAQYPEMHMEPHLLSELDVRSELILRHIDSLGPSATLVSMETCKTVHSKHFPRSSMATVDPAHCVLQT